VARLCVGKQVVEKAHDAADDALHVTEDSLPFGVDLADEFRIARASSEVR
jgi:hypothetical protein